MSITGVTTDLPPRDWTTTDRPLTTSEQPSSVAKAATTNESTDNSSFPRLAGSVVMIFVAVLGSVIASWIARKICPDSWTGKYCHSCRDYVSSMQSKKRRKSAIVLPVDEDSGSVIRWTSNGGPLATVRDHQKKSETPSRVPGVSTNGPSKGSSGEAKKPSGPTRPRGKPSFMTIGSLVTTFTVPKSDLTEIAMEQLEKERKAKDKAEKKIDKPSSAGGSKPNDLKSDTSSSEQFDDETNSKEMLITESPVNSQEEKVHQEGEVRTRKARTGETDEQESEKSKDRRTKSLRKQDSGEIIHLREITKSVSPSQKSETYSSDFESMTTARTVESLHRMNESPIRTIHEDFKT